jgi:hypothetical protein
MTDLSMSLSEPGSGVPVLPQPDKAITNGWRRDTPPYADPPQVGDPYAEILKAVSTGVEL